MKTGLAKALFIALPVTLFFGTTIIMGIMFSLYEIFRLIEQRTNPNSYNYGKPILLIEVTLSICMFFSSFLGLFGLIGAWLAFVFQTKLDNTLGKLNKIVSWFLLMGIAGVFILISYSVGAYIVESYYDSRLKEINVTLVLALLFLTGLSAYALKIRKRVLHITNITK